jgi:hypothetical protein
MSAWFVYVLILFSLTDFVIRVLKTILYTFVVEGDNGRYCSHQVDHGEVVRSECPALEGEGG